MENKDISQIALERIKGEGIKPISRSVFSIKRVLFWTVVAISFIVGVFAFTLVLSALFNNDWYLYGKLGFNFVFKTLPYFWVSSLLVFTVLAEYYYRKTLLGHRHRFIMIMGVYLVSTAALGSALYIYGVGDVVEQSLENNAPVYSGYILNRHQVWFHPEEGLLSGKIIKVGDKEIELVDMNNIVWVVNIENSTNQEQSLMILGDRIKIIGDKIDNKSFDADEIRPWGKMR